VDLDRVRQLRIAIDRTTGVFGTRHA
jgi:hypothetical protein